MNISLVNNTGNLRYGAYQGRQSALSPNSNNNGSTGRMAQAAMNTVGSTRSGGVKASHAAGGGANLVRGAVGVRASDGLNSGADGEMQSLLRSLDRKQSPKTDSDGKTLYQAESKDKVNGFLKMSGSPDAKSDPKTKKKLIYNYKDVSSQIQRAKTSSSAGQAAIKAKGKVLELKRKLASGKEDSGEIMAALSHAKRMERVAKKKKHNLELEELVEHTQNQDEQQEKLEEPTSSMRYDFLDMAEERVSDALADIDEQQMDAMGEVFDETGYSDMGHVETDYDYPETYSDMSDYLSDYDLSMLSSSGMTMDELMSGDGLSDELFSAIDDFMDEMGGEQQRMLEETMEQLQNMEVVDPHMSKAELAELKTKHRNAERKEMLKADMDYLKHVFDQMNKEKAQPLPTGGAQASPMAMPGISVSAGTPSAAEVAMGGFDAAV